MHQKTLHAKKHITNYRKYHDMLKAIAKIDGCYKHICDDTCRYWKFSHLDKPCVLSSRFTVHKGEFCMEYVAKNSDFKNDQ